jgi:hypothetical protein
MKEMKKIKTKDGLIIHIDSKIRTKYFEGFDRLKDNGAIQHIRDIKLMRLIIHGTGGGGTYRWMLMGARRASYKKGVGTFHYLIQRNGTVIEIIDPNKWTKHSHSGKQDRINFGVELVNPSWWNGMKYTDKQYDSLFKLIDYLRLERHYPIKVIRSHNRTKQLFTGTGKKCPGKKFDWKRLGRFLGSLWTEKKETFIIQGS